MAARPSHSRTPDPWSPAERRAFARLDRPAAIQRFLDEVPYSCEPVYRSPRSVLRDRLAHCFDGALFAAAALRRLGLPPLLVDLRATRDDDHLLAIYRVGGHLGAVAQSNFAALRYREPIFRTLRELVLSYFEGYFNLEGEKTLRSYSRPLDLGTLDHVEWMTCDDRLEVIAERLDEIRHFPLLTPAMIRGLAPVDARSFQSGTVGTNPAGAYHVKG